MLDLLYILFFNQMRAALISAAAAVAVVFELLLYKTYLGCLSTFFFQSVIFYCLL